MVIDTKTLITMTDADQDFSKVVRVVDEQGVAVIMKNNKPRYVVVDFDEYNDINAALQMRKAKIDAATEAVISDNLEAFQELAK